MLVLWSGGCDSTLCLLDAAKLGPVRAVSIAHANVPAGSEQAAARAAILKRIQPDRETISHKTITISHDHGGFDWHSAGGLNQVALWLANAQLFLLDNEDLCMGYIRSDDVWHYRQCIVEIWERFRAVLHKTGNLIFPLEWLSKADVIRRLRDDGVLDLCWYCESPRDGIACGRCTSCLTHATGLARLEIEDRDGSYKETMMARKVTKSGKGKKKAAGKSSKKRATKKE